MQNHPAKILIIEDNPGDVFLFHLALDHHKEEYELVLLRDGEEAIRFVHEQRHAAKDSHPCVMVLDLNLPKHDGHTVLQAIRQEPVLEHVGVVVVSTGVSPKERFQIERLGVRLYRPKPMELDQWVALAGEILEICREGIGMAA